MKRTPILLLTFATFCTLVALMRHVQTRRALAELQRERLQLLADKQRAHAAQAEIQR